jgi:hypothetical protein
MGKANAKCYTEQPVILDDGLLDSANRAISSDSNADDANQDASLCNPTATLSCPGNNLGSEKLLGGSLNSALIEQPNAISAYPRNPSPTCLGEPLKDPARQSKDDAHISRDGRLEQCQSTADVLGGVNSEEEQKQRDSKNSGDSDSDQHSDGSDGPRPAKRRRKLQPSPSRSSSRLDRSHTALGQTQLELAPSLGCDGHRGADAEPASIMSSAEYQEWPLHGFLKRTTIGHDIHYGIEFSLEQLQPPTCPPHISWASSNRDSSTASASSSLLSTQAKKIKSGPPSQSMRTRFTSEEDARLVDLKEMKGWSWEKIETEFPGRTRATLQVRYCTKLKTRAAASNQRRH